jgi:cytochrome c oxidase subunit IV
MSDTTTTHDDHGHEHSHYIVPVRLYAMVLAGLAILMFATVYAAFFDLGPATVILALLIATTKATLIVLIFMNVYFSTRLTKIFVLGGFFWLVFLFGLIIIDFISRQMVTNPLPWE